MAQFFFIFHDALKLGMLPGLALPGLENLFRWPYWLVFLFLCNLSLRISRFLPTYVGYFIYCCTPLQSHPWEEVGSSITLIDKYMKILAIFAQLVWVQCYSDCKLQKTSGAYLAESHPLLLVQLSQFYTCHKGLSESLRHTDLDLW